MVLKFEIPVLTNVTDSGFIDFQEKCYVPRRVGVEFAQSADSQYHYLVFRVEKDTPNFVICYMLSEQ